MGELFTHDSSLPLTSIRLTKKGGGKKLFFVLPDKHTSDLSTFVAPGSFQDSSQSGLQSLADHFLSINTAVWNLEELSQQVRSLQTYQHIFESGASL